MSVLKIVTAHKHKGACAMAERDEGKTSQQCEKGHASVKMDVTEVTTDKYHGLGDIVTLNVGGKK